MTRINVFNAFYVNTWSLLYSFKFQGGGYKPYSPPISATASIDHSTCAAMATVTNSNKLKPEYFTGEFIN